MKAALLVLFAVGLSSARTITYHNVNISSDQPISDEDLLKNWAQSIEVFDQSLDDYIDWVSFDKMFEEMINHSGQYSVWSIGNIRAYFLKSRDLYYDAVASVFEWCSLIDTMMTAFVSLYEDYSDETKEQQKELIVASLDDGINRMGKAIGLLDDSRNHVNTGIVDLTNVISNVSAAFRRDESEHTTQINNLDKSAMNSLSQSFFGGIISLIMTETVYKPEARKKFEKIEGSFNFMRDKIQNAIRKALEIKEKLSQEVIYISGLRGTVKGNKLIFSESFRIRIVTTAVNKLKGQCSAYQTRHGKKQ
ncbi:hemolysin E-like [Bactrocera dorsalis]|uniref:Hemolysin E-like n=1 Tax=Bactrocera dorsalis TaxID=27457 RepID=A0ABM3J4X2_BACDO|nr:hemolysin E-like [Bactrocera dorsalis]XP_049304278.1 hemolysin E-like [Bactrocera dorsalis]